MTPSMRVIILDIFTISAFPSMYHQVCYNAAIKANDNYKGFDGWFDQYCKRLED